MDSELHPPRGMGRKEPIEGGQSGKGGKKDLGCRRAPVTAEMSVEFEQRAAERSHQGLGHITFSWAAPQVLGNCATNPN